MVMQQNINLCSDDEKSHQFSFYAQNCSTLCQIENAVFTIEDECLVHRVVRVVKLKTGDNFIIFDQKQNVLVELLECFKSKIKVRIVSLQKNIILTPQITFLLPVLKKEALEEAIYSLAEIGINYIQLVSTEKSRKQLTTKDIDRLQKIIISAAEQCKNYAFPVIYSIKSLQECLNDLSLNSDKIIFDISGESFFKVHKQISLKNMYITIGPEGGLTVQELSMIKKYGFKVCSLTPTTLRALQAVAVGAALFRVS